MSRDWSFDFANDTPEFIDSGGRLPEGWYKAKLIKTEDEQQRGGKELTFQVTAGQYAGQTAAKSLWNPQFSDTPEKMRNAATAAKNWAYRLGLITKEDIKSGKNVAVNWDKAINVERIIHVKKRTYKDKQGNDQETVEIAYMGCFPFDHPDIPAEVRTMLNLGPARPREPGDGQAPASASGSTTAPAAPPPNAADLAKSLWN
jgi:hypothetical protein